MSTKRKGAAKAPAKVTTYVVRFERDDPGWWHVSVPSVPGCRTQARTLAQGRRRIREALATAVDDADTATLVVDVRLGTEVGAVLKRTAKARKVSDEAAAEAAKATKAAVRALASKGVSMRDAAELVGVSHQRIGQLAAQE